MWGQQLVACTLKQCNENIPEEDGLKLAVLFVGLGTFPELRVTL